MLRSIWAVGASSLSPGGLRKEEYAHQRGNLKGLLRGIATVMSDAFSLQWGQFGAAVGAIGSLGIAAFGVVESFGKAFAFTVSFGRARKHFHCGLPYAGLAVVLNMIEPLRPALKCAYGVDFVEIIAQQYRSGRSLGSAPDTIRQGVRLGLPFLSTAVASKLIGDVWHMDSKHATALAIALQAPGNATDGATAGASSAGPVDQAQALAGRFSTALDTRINAAFQHSDERYQTVAKTAAGVMAVLLATTFNWYMGGNDAQGHWQPIFNFPIAIGIGLVAVPLAPVAKDISTSLQNALTAFKTISGKS
jgi:hypothetical protein